MVLTENEPVTVQYASDFVSLDQAVSDLQAPKPETRWCLLELPPDQLKTLEEGQSFHFRELSGGAPGDGFAALCTADSTFRVEFLENSNTLLLGQVKSVDKENAGGNCSTLEQSRCNVFAQCRGQLILKPEKVDMNKVRELLRPSALGQVAAEDQQKLLTFQELQCHVAGSTAELKQVLHDGPYVELDGKWRLMPEKLKTQILDTALTVVTAHGWPLKAVDGPSLLEEVQKTLPDGEVSVASLGVLQKALASVVATSPGADAPQEGEEAGSSTFNLDPQKISGFRALQILREDPQEVRRRYELPPPVPQKVGIKRPRLAKTVMPGSGALQVDEFLQIFKELTNTEMTSDQVLQAVCEGSAYVDEFEGTIHALDATTLPRDPLERLKLLLEIQSHWRPERLVSLMSSSLKGVKVEPWLAKHSRQVFLDVAPGEEVRMMTKKFA